MGGDNGRPRRRSVVQRRRPAVGAGGDARPCKRTECPLEQHQADEGGNDGADGSELADDAFVGHVQEQEGEEQDHDNEKRQTENRVSATALEGAPKPYQRPTSPEWMRARSAATDLSAHQAARLPL